MIPMWKIRRELERFRTQLAAIPSLLLQPIVQRRYDQKRHENILVEIGEVECSDNLAIFLIFQPSGVSPSILQTCEFLTGSGFAPIVISNAPLNSDDRAVLRKNAHLVVQRPNYGYDFGGYRDGVWLVNNRGLSPKSVLFLNDSVWLPVFPQTELLDRMIDAPEDYVGTQVFGDIAARGKARGFFGSYCFCVKGPVWQSKVFQDFWSGYKNSSNKEVTLRRGERAFSRLILSECGGGAALFDNERFRAVVDALTEPELREAIRDMVVTDPKLEAAQAAMLKRGLEKASCAEMTELLLASARSKNYIAAAPILSLRNLGFPMIKKNNERHYQLARQRILRAIEEGRLNGLESAVVEELRARD